MTLRKMTALALGISSLVALGACAEARPLTTNTIDGRGGPGPLANRAAGYELEVLVDGVPAPTFFQAGGTYVLGQQGQRYTLRIANRTGRRVEAVVSVDGRDVVDGRPAETGKRGYLVPAWGQVEIDGWRLTRAEVAAFRFSSVADSYAARTGSAREVGVIGAAIFPERYVPRPRPPRPLELPYSERRREEYYDAPDDLESGGRGVDKSSAPQAPAASGAPSARSSAEAAPEPSPSRRHGLGTEFGEAHGSSVREVAFVRASAGTPSVVLGARYNDREGLVALGIDVEPDACGGWACDRDLGLRETATPFPVTERRYAAPPPCWRHGTCR